MELIEAYKKRLDLSKKVYEKVIPDSYKTYAWDELAETLFCTCLDDINKVLLHYFTSYKEAKSLTIGTIKKNILDLMTVLIPLLMSDIISRDRDEESNFSKIFDNCIDLLKEYKKL